MKSVSSFLFHFFFTLSSSDRLCPFPDFSLKRGPGNKPSSNKKKNHENQEARLSTVDTGLPYHRLLTHRDGVSTRE